jgi:hypothetical protein
MGIELEAKFYSLSKIGKDPGTKRKYQLRMRLGLGFISI